MGIGEDGIEGLTVPARDLIQSAEVVFGGARHLKLAASLIRGAVRAWTTPFDQTMADVLAYRGRLVCVLASGDPFCHGVGSLLAHHVSRIETLAVPARSAFSLAASRLLWPLPQTVQLSLCGRPLDFIRPHLHPGARILALTSGGGAPASLARLLCELRFGPSQLTVLELLGGPDEAIHSARADSFGVEHVDSLNTVAIEVVADDGARILPRAPGLADELFEHDGQITKREIRALTLSALAPRRGELLWDVGAGSGSVSIEWLLADVSLSAIAIERRGERAERIRRNAAGFGVSHLQLIQASAPDAFEGLPMPNAVFIGGGSNTPGLIETAQRALSRGGRLVINAVTLATESLLLTCHSHMGGSLTRVAISRAGPVAGDAAHMGWKPARPIMQWTWVKS